MDSDKIMNIGDIAIGFCSRLTGDEDEFLHTHDFVEALLIETGSIEHEYNGVHEELHVGDCRILFPGVAHEFHRHGPCVHRDFLMRVPFYRQLSDRIDAPFFQQLEKDKTRLIHVSHQDILYLEEKSTVFFGLPAGPAKARMEQTMASYLLFLFYTAGIESENLNPFRVEITDLTNQLFTYPDAAKRIRDKMPYNEKYFCKKFRETFNEPFITYLNRHKMEYAQYLLQMTDLSMEEICSKVGIESVSYFHKLYRRTFGVTPTKTRNTAKKSSSF